MSPRTAHILLSALLVAMLASCGQPQPTVTKLTAKDADSTVTLRVGDSLEIALEGNPTTGYTWETAPGAGSLLEQRGEREFKPDSSALGSGGMFMLRFKAIQQGEAQLKLIYHRTFEPNAPPLQAFEIKLVVGK